MQDHKKTTPETGVMEDKDTQQVKERKKEPLKKKLFWWAVYALIALMMAAGVYMILIQYIYIGDNKPFEAPPTYAPVAATPAPTQAATDIPSDTAPAPTPTQEPAPVIPLAPVQITLTEPEIQCDIEPVGAQDGEMGTIDSASIIAWYRDGMAPNEDGNCILNGHVSWKGKKGAFAYLNEIKEGEEVVLKLEDGSYLYYEVYSVEEHPYDNFPTHHMTADGMHRLTLITCKGDYDRAAGTSLTRTVVVCLPKLDGESV